MELNHEQLENLKKLLSGWNEVADRLDQMANLAYGLSMIGLGEELKWSTEKIKKFMPMGLMDEDEGPSNG